MPHLPKRSLQLLLALGCWPTAQVQSEPILVGNYHVQVFHRFSYQTELTEPFQQQFPLRITLHGPVSPRDDFRIGMSRTYGVPTFSDVPLSVPSAPEGLAVGTRGDTRHVAVNASFTEFTWQQQAVAFSAINELGDTAPLDYFRFTSLENRLTGLASPPELTPRTFLEHLSPPGDQSVPFNFTYAGYLHVGQRIGPPQFLGPSYAYYGTATLADIESPPAVPEPATVALLGIALSVAAVENRRRMRRCHDLPALLAPTAGGRGRRTFPQIVSRLRRGTRAVRPRDPS